MVKDTLMFSRKKNHKSNNNIFFHKLNEKYILDKYNRFKLFNVFTIYFSQTR